MSKISSAEAAASSTSKTPQELGLDLIEAITVSKLHKAIELIRAGADVNTKDQDGNTPLHKASQYGHTELAKLLIGNGADVNAATEVGWKPLHKASLNGYTETAKLLIGNGADVNTKDKDGVTPLYIASLNGYTETAKLLIDNGADVNAATKYGVTPLHLASHYGYTETAKLLIGNGADVNTKDKDGWTPLHLASHYGYTEIVRELIRADADVNAKSLFSTRDLEITMGATPLDIARKNSHAMVEKELIEAGAYSSIEENGRTPLHVASEIGDLESVKKLIKSGAEVNAKFEGETPLSLACRNAYTNVALELIKSGADVNYKIEDGKTVLHLASENGMSSIALKLVSENAHMESRDSKGHTPFYTACISGNEKLALKFLELGADVNVVDIDGNSVLYHLFRDNRIEFAAKLVDKGAKVNLINNEGNTMLHSLCLEGDTKKILELIKLGGDVLNKNKKGETPLHIASKSGNIELVKILIDQGANIEVLNDNGRSFIQYSDAKLLSKLMEDKIGINLTDKDGETLIFAHLRESNVDTVFALLRSGADLKIINNDGLTAFDSAPFELQIKLLMYGLPTKTIEFIREYGSSKIYHKGQFVTEVKNLCKQDVLELHKKGHIDINKMLHESGKFSLVPVLEAYVELYPDRDIMEADSDGRTILHYASSDSTLSFITELFNKDAGRFEEELDKKDNFGKSAREYISDETTCVPEEIYPDRILEREWDFDEYFVERVDEKSYIHTPYNSRITASYSEASLPPYLLFGKSGIRSLDLPQLPETDFRASQSNDIGNNMASIVLGTIAFLGFIYAFFKISSSSTNTRIDLEGLNESDAALLGDDN